MAQFRASATVDFRANESIPVTSTGAVKLTLSLLQPTDSSVNTVMEYALISVETTGTNGPRFYVSGLTADSSGHLTNNNDVVELEGSNNLVNFSAITTGSSA